MPYAIFLAIALAGIATYLISRQYETWLRPKFRVGLKGWRIIRFLILLLIGYGLAVSGRFSMQIAAVLIAAFAVLWLTLSDSAPATTQA
jgi:hypothetical protein